jgi:hypothetical protein
MAIVAASAVQTVNAPKNFKVACIQSPHTNGAGWIEANSHLCASLHLGISRTGSGANVTPSSEDIFLRDAEHRHAFVQVWAAGAKFHGSLAHVALVQEAEKLVPEALESHRISGSTAAEKIGYLRVLLGTVLLSQSRYADAATLLNGTLEDFSRTLPPDHQYIAMTECG